MITKIYTPDFIELLKSENIIILDVREEDEFAAGHIPGAINHPLSRFHDLSLPKDKDVIFYCRSGYRSQIAIENYCSQHAVNQVLRNYYDYKDGYLGYIESQKNLSIIEND